MKKAATRTITSREPNTIITIPYSGNGSVSNKELVEIKWEIGTRKVNLGY